MDAKFRLTKHNGLDLFDFKFYTPKQGGLIGYYNNYGHYSC